MLGLLSMTQSSFLEQTRCQDLPRISPCCDRLGVLKARVQAKADQATPCPPTTPTILVSVFSIHSGSFSVLTSNRTSVGMLPPDEPTPDMRYLPFYRLGGDF